MRVTRLTSIGPPWDWGVAERISKILVCHVERYHRKPYELIVHAECTVEQLRFVIPQNFDYTLRTEELDERSRTTPVS